MVILPLIPFCKVRKFPGLPPAIPKGEEMASPVLVDQCHAEVFCLCVWL